MRFLDAQIYLPLIFLIHYLQLEIVHFQVTFEGMVIEIKLGPRENARLPIDFTLSGITIEERFEHL